MSSSLLGLLRRHFFRQLGIVCVLGIGGLSLAAQDRASNPKTDPANDDEVVTLPEFQVSASDRINDYIASEAMSGTRTGAKLIEVPYNVQVVTNEFLEDFQLFGDYNVLPTVPNFSPDDSGRLRGFRPIVMRDGFSRAGPATLANTKQVEAIMGPQSALYGQSSPGGILNYVSKRPSLRNRNRITYSAGSYDYERFEVETTGPLVGKKLYYMVDAAQRHTSSATDFTETDLTSYTVGLLARFSDNTSVSLNWEQQFQSSVEGAGVPTLVVGSLPTVNGNPTGFIRKNGVEVGPYLPLAGFNRLGPYQDSDSLFNSLTMLVEHRFNTTWSARLNLLYYHRIYDDEGWTSGLQFDQTTQRMWPRTPDKQYQTIDNYSIQGEALAQFSTWGIPHKLLLAADYTWDFYENDQWRLTTADNNALNVDTRFLNPFNAYWTKADYSKLTRVVSDLDRKYEHAGLTASLRSVSFGNRLITSASARYAYTKADITDRYNNFAGISDEDGMIYSAGANWRLSDDALILYANASTSYEPSTTFDKGINEPRKSERGRGVEAGLKGASADGRLGYTLSVFGITKTNVSSTNLLYTTPGAGVPQYLTDGEIRARGVELVTTARPTDELTVIGSIGYLDAEIMAEDALNNPSRLGDRPLNVSDLTAAVSARYSFQHGMLKGFKVGVTGTYTGDRVSQYEDRRTYVSASQSERYVTPSLYLLSGYASYEWRQGRRLRHSFAVNVRNAFDKFYLTSTYKLGNGREFLFTYRVSF